MVQPRGEPRGPWERFADGRRIVAWGVGNAFRNACRSVGPSAIDYAVDDFRAGGKVEGVEVFPPDRLASEDRDEALVVVFTLSSDVLQTIVEKAAAYGFEWGRNLVDQSALQHEELATKMAAHGIDLPAAWLPAIRSSFFTLPMKNHSSILGTWLLLGLLRRTRGLSGDAVELGVYEGGNAYVAALGMALAEDERRYVLVDSFEGFGELSEHDPQDKREMFRDGNFARVSERFRELENVTIVKGYVPDILAELNDEHYSFVYYDCDLYEPAKRSLEHFYDRLPPGGVFIADDYSVSTDFLGVRKAVDEFCADRGVSVIEVPETTHGIIIRPDRP